MAANGVQRLEPGELEQVQVRFFMPRYLRDELREAARAQTITMASLLRIIVLDFTRHRHEAPL